MQRTARMAVPSAIRLKVERGSFNVVILAPNEGDEHGSSTSWLRWHWRRALALAGCQRADEAAQADKGELAAATEAPLARTVSDGTLQWGACPAVFPAGCEMAVLHGDPAKPNADLFLRVPGGYAIPAHTHSSAERIILVTGKLDVKYQGAQPITLSPETTRMDRRVCRTKRRAWRPRPAPFSLRLKGRWMSSRSRVH